MYPELIFNFTLFLVVLSVFLYSSIENSLSLFGISFSFLFTFFALYHEYCTKFSYGEIWNVFLTIFVFVIFVVLIFLIEEMSLEIILLYISIYVGFLVVLFSNNLMITYLGIELQAFPSFILISKDSVSINGSEGGLKYFVLGAISSGFYLFGLSLLFSAGISPVVEYLYINSENPLISLGSTMITVALCFNIALFPLHFWLPDIYEASSWDVLSVLATIPNVSILSLVFQLIWNSNLFLICSVFSIVIGTLGALNQTNLNSLIGYSSITHIGFIVLAYSIISVEGNQTSIFYLIIYMITSLTLFLCIVHHFWTKNYFIVEFCNLQYYNKLLALIFLVLFFSLAGVPPLSGFLVNWFVLWHLITNQHLAIGIIIILFSILGAGYYLSVINIIYFESHPGYLGWCAVLSSNPNPTLILSVFLSLGLYFSFFLILNLSPLILSINYNFFSLL